MSHKDAKTIRQWMRNNDLCQPANDVEYRKRHRQIVLVEACGRAIYQRWKKKLKQR